jgi:CDP-diacylglycerol---serine O-phosphatidyltransferase
MNLPAMLTISNLFCGFSSLLFIAAARFESAVWMLILAAFFDSIDGKVARAYGQSSDFGVQLDSLADVVSFGVVPSFLLYQYYFKAFSTFGIIFSFLPLVFATFRLARFNVTVDKNQKDPKSTGLASPMGAMAISSLVLLHTNTNWGVLKFSLLILVPIVCFLMMSTIKYSGFPKISWKSSWINRIHLLVFVISLLTFPFYPHAIPTVFMMAYLFSGPFEYLISALHPVVLEPQDTKNLYG